MKKLWNKWKEIVDTHNKDISYTNYDDAWGYDMIFYPLFLGILVGFMFFISSFSFSLFLYGFFGMSSACYTFLILLPILIEKRTRKN